MADPETRRDSSARVQIIIALIGLAGVIATALIANWTNIFPRKGREPTPANTSGGSQPGSSKRPDRPSQGAERPVHSSGRATIRGTYMFDLDKGEETQAGADFFWEQQNSVIRFLTPQNGAGFYVVGPTSFESVRWSDMEHYTYSSARIDAGANANNRIPAGTVVAYRTNEGRLGKFIVDEYGYNLTIRWRTYD